VVSHDRAFLDNVVTSTLVLEGNGVVGEYVGGYSDWVRQRRAAMAASAKPAATARAKNPQSAAPAVPKKRRLSLKETSELAALPDRVDAMESERDQLFASLADPALLRDAAALAKVRARLAALETELRTAMARWEALELIASGK
jgi:ATP-binding cassette subfamily F protein uup